MRKVFIIIIVICIGNILFAQKKFDLSNNILYKTKLFQIYKKGGLEYTTAVFDEIVNRIKKRKDFRAYKRIIAMSGESDGSISSLLGAYYKDLLEWNPKRFYNMVEKSNNSETVYMLMLHSYYDNFPEKYLKINSSATKKIKKILKEKSNY